MAKGIRFITHYRNWITHSRELKDKDKQLQEALILKSELSIEYGEGLGLSVNF
jgi:hypothetical protein